MSEVDRQKLASIQQLGLWPTQDPQVRAQQHQSPALMGLPDTLAIVGDGSLRDDQPLVLPSGATVESHTRQLDPNSTETTLTTRYRGQTMTSSRTDLHVAGAEGSKQTLTFGSDNRLDEITITRNDVTRHYFPVLDDQGHRIPGLYVGGDGAYRYPIQVATDDHGNPIAVTELPKQSDAPSGSSGHHGLLGDALRGGWNFGKGLVEPLRDTFAGAAGATGAFDGLSDETRRENNLPNRADILKGFKQQGLDLGTAMLADQKAGNHWGVLNEGSKLTIGTDWTQFPDHPAETAGNAVTGLALVLAPTKFLKGFRGERIPDLDYPDLPNGVLGGLGNSDHAVTTKIPGPAGNSARSAELQGSGLLPRDSGGSEPQQPQISSGLSAPTSGDGVRPPRPTYDPWNNHYDPWNDGLAGPRPWDHDPSGRALNNHSLRGGQQARFGRSPFGDGHADPGLTGPITEDEGGRAAIESGESVSPADHDLPAVGDGNLRLPDTSGRRPPGIRKPRSRQRIDISVRGEFGDIRATKVPLSAADEAAILQQADLVRDLQAEWDEKAGVEKNIYRHPRVQDEIRRLDLKVPKNGPAPGVLSNKDLQRLIVGLQETGTPPSVINDLEMSSRERLLLQRKIDGSGSEKEELGLMGGRAGLPPSARRNILTGGTRPASDESTRNSVDLAAADLDDPNHPILYVNETKGTKPGSLDGLKGRRATYGSGAGKTVQEGTPEWLEDVLPQDQNLAAKLNTPEYAPLAQALRDGRATVIYKIVQTDTDGNVWQWDVPVDPGTKYEIPETASSIPAASQISLESRSATPAAPTVATSALLSDLAEKMYGHRIGLSSVAVPLALPVLDSNGSHRKRINQSLTVNLSLRRHHAKRLSLAEQASFQSYAASFR